MASRQKHKQINEYEVNRARLFIRTNQSQASVSPHTRQAAGTPSELGINQIQRFRFDSPGVSKTVPGVTLPAEPAHSRSPARPVGGG